MPEGNLLLNGVVVINKAAGMTSHDVVARARRILGTKRVGHAGTLDPLATGVLILLVGPATKLFEKFVGFDKAYRATLILGQITRSADIEGEVLEQRPYHDVSEGDVRRVFNEFLGERQQTPPMVSAVKVQGKRLYQLARQGLNVARSSRTIQIHRIDLLGWAPPEVSFLLECSKGTYVRQFAEDAGERLGCGACISQIERTKVGPFSIDQAVDLEGLRVEHVRPWSAAQGELVGR